MLCALFPDTPCLAMTATASQTDMQTIKDSLGLKNAGTLLPILTEKISFTRKCFGMVKILMTLN